MHGLTETLSKLTLASSSMYVDNMSLVTFQGPQLVEDLVVVVGGRRGGCSCSSCMHSWEG